MLETARRYLHTLCDEIPTRRVGSNGNRQATDFLASTFRSCGLSVETPTFDCMDWREEGATLRCGKSSFAVHPSPYSLGCSVEAPLLHATTTEELEAVDGCGRIVLLHGHIAPEQLMPKNFVFFNPEEHQRIVALLESKGFAGIITATSRNHALAGGMYPFPLIEDGDFNVPSVFMTETEGEKLLAHAGQSVILESHAERIPSKGCNVIGRTNSGEGPKLVVCAHIDAKLGTPGATDDATGTIILALLAQLLATYEGKMPIELVAFNGEDYYAASGEMIYLESIRQNPKDIMLAVNIDGVGYVKGKTAWTVYEGDSELEHALDQAFATYPGIVRGEPWYQGDHGLFTFSGIPAAALTTEALDELMTHTHTPRDNPSIVDCTKLVELSEALHNLVLQLARQ